MGCTQPSVQYESLVPNPSWVRRTNVPGGILEFLTPQSYTDIHNKEWLLFLKCQIFRYVVDDPCLCYLYDINNDKFISLMKNYQSLTQSPDEFDRFHSYVIDNNDHMLYILYGTKFCHARLIKVSIKNLDKIEIVEKINLETKTRYNNDNDSCLNCHSTTISTSASPPIPFTGNMILDNDNNKIHIIGGIHWKWQHYVFNMKTNDLVLMDDFIWKIEKESWLSRYNEIVANQTKAIENKTSIATMDSNSEVATGTGKASPNFTRLTKQDFFVGNTIDTGRDDISEKYRLAIILCVKPERIDVREFDINDDNKDKELCAKRGQMLESYFDKFKESVGILTMDVPGNIKPILDIDNNLPADELLYTIKNQLWEKYKFRINLDNNNTNNGNDNVSIYNDRRQWIYINFKDKQSDNYKDKIFCDCIGACYGDYFLHKLAPAKSQSSLTEMYHDMRRRNVGNPIMFLYREKQDDNKIGMFRMQTPYFKENAPVTSYVFYWKILNSNSQYDRCKSLVYGYTQKFSKLDSSISIPIDLSNLIFEYYFEEIYTYASPWKCQRFPISKKSNKFGKQQAQNNKNNIIVSWFSYSTIFLRDGNGKEIILIFDLRNGIYKLDIKKQSLKKISNERLQIGEQSDWDPFGGIAAVLSQNKQHIHCLTKNGHRSIPLSTYI